RAIPDALVPGAFALDDPAAVLGLELAPRHIERYAALLGELLHVLLAFGVGLGLPGLHGPAAQGFGLVGNDEPVIDTDGAPEAAAGVACAHRRVERKEAGGGLLVRAVALRAVQRARVTPGGERPRRVAVV